MDKYTKYDKHSKYSSYLECLNIPEFEPYLEIILERWPFLRDATHIPPLWRRIIGDAVHLHKIAKSHGRLEIYDKWIRVFVDPSAPKNLEFSLRGEILITCPTCDNTGNSSAPCGRCGRGLMNL